jgi:guanosine-3',5'-bis(diphosphate) 3'-pyrophosphohydrolase
MTTDSQIEKRFTDLLQEVLIYNPKADIPLLKKSWEYAKLAHDGQQRLSGEDYITHPLAVAGKLISWKLDTATIAAGFLHDTIEDGAGTREDLDKLFGPDVAALVDGVTKVTKLRLRGKSDDAFVETLRKMIITMAKDLRVVFVKLADRTHNMTTLAALPPKRQRENAKETL